MNDLSLEAYFLPYQRRWLADDAKIKISEKSRRIGMTYVQSWEDVQDIVLGRVPVVWFSSADESAAKEYIFYCSKWAKLLDIVARDLGEIVIDKDRDIKALTIEFANGGRINALSSNPKGFRSKGGKVVLDEFAWHDDQEGMWAAARPVITWGFPLRILSTHNGRTSLYNRFIERIRRGELGWSLHTVNIYQAVADGLYDKIAGRVTSPEERDAWIEEIHADCVDEDTWQQEYCCTPTDEASAFLPYDLIRSCEEDTTLTADLQALTGDLYVGVDIGRRKDLTVCWVGELLGGVLYTRRIIVLERTPFREQREVLYELLRHPKLRRACIDATGLGMQLAEEAIDQFGRYRIEAVTFNGPVKEDLSYRLRSRMEDRRLVIPADTFVRDSFHAIRKTTSASGNVRFDAAANDLIGHADRYWAAALAVHAADDITSVPVRITTGGERFTTQLLRGY
jgi:phage FluMu gp28-like protein